MGKSGESLKASWKTASIALMGKNTESLLLSTTKASTKPPEPEYLTYFKEYTYTKPQKLDNLVRKIQKRLADSQWIVVLKSLYLVHILLKEGDSEFYKRMATQLRPVHLGDFSISGQHGFNGDHSASDRLGPQFIFVYHSYLDAKFRSYKKIGKDFIRCKAFIQTDFYKKLSHSDTLAIMYYAKLQLEAFLQLKNNIASFTHIRLLATGLIPLIEDARYLHNVLVVGLVSLLESFTGLSDQHKEDIVMYLTWLYNSAQIHKHILINAQGLFPKNTLALCEIPPIAIEIIKSCVSTEKQELLLSAASQAEDFDRVQVIDREISLVYFGKNAKSSEIWLNSTVDLDNLSVEDKPPSSTTFNPFLLESSDSEPDNDDGFVIPTHDFTSAHQQQQQQKQTAQQHPTLLDFSLHENPTKTTPDMPSKSNSSSHPPENNPNWAESTFDPFASFSPAPSAPVEASQPAHSKSTPHPLSDFDPLLVSMFNHPTSPHAQLEPEMAFTHTAAPNESSTFVVRLNTNSQQQYQQSLPNYDVIRDLYPTPSTQIHSSSSSPQPNPAYNFNFDSTPQYHQQPSSDQYQYKETNPFL